MSVFKCCFYPKKSAIEETGAHPMAIAIDASNMKLATAKATLKFAEDHSDIERYYFNPKIFLDDEDEVLALELNIWDYEILNDFEWDEKTKSLKSKAPVLSEQDQEQTDGTDHSGTIESHKLPLNTELAHFWMGGLFTATQDEQRAARSAVMDTDDSYLQNVILAVNSVEACKHCYNHIRYSLVSNIKKIWPVDGKTPELSSVAAFVKEWMLAISDESTTEDTLKRQDITEKWITKHQKARTPSGATAGGGNLTDRGEGFRHDFDSLAMEVALGIVARAMDFDIYNPSVGVVNRARDIIKLKEKPFSETFDVYRQCAGILDYSRAMVIYSVKYTPDDAYHKSGGLLSYIRRTLTETNHAQPDPRIVAAACGTQPTKQAENETTPAPKNTDSTVDTQPQQTTTVATDTAQSQPAPEKLEAESHEKQLAETASNEVEKTEVAAAQPSTTTFQSIGAALENDLAEKGDNMKIWRSVMRTDPRYTKDLSGVGFDGTSINAEYMIMRATEIFGPVGTGWGFEVIEDRMLPGAPMSEAIYEDKKFIGNRILRDGNGTLITEKNHSIKIKFWYAIEGEIRGEVEAYGATKYLYKSKHGITCDGEAQKKSLTDAIKKALSLLGFSADVWLGLYDQPEYKQENALQFELANASEKAEDIPRIRKELDEKFKLNTDSMRSAVTPNEVSGIASSLTRVMGVHLKVARDKADHEYTKYLEGRLRRLEEVKSECLAKLQEKAA